LANRAGSAQAGPVRIRGALEIRLRNFHGLEILRRDFAGFFIDALQQHGAVGCPLAFSHRFLLLVHSVQAAYNWWPYSPLSGAGGMRMRKVRCRECGTLNRLSTYSIRRMPQCGKCHVSLPETRIITAARKLSAIPRLVWVGIPAAFGILIWAGWTMSAQSNAVVARPAAPVTRQAACTSEGPTTVGPAIYRVYDTQDRPRLTRWTINAGIGADYFVKLIEIGSRKAKVSYFVRGGSAPTTDVPTGTFTVRHASGTGWCSERELFGPDTVVQEGTRVAVFEEDYTYTLFLTPTQNGNFPTKLMSRNDF
jgi:hypothetical protein